jgi:hypothetical protein
VEWADEDADLGEMLERGEIDALISADAPRCVLEGSPNVGRLFEDYVAVERDYFRRTGIFPIMHTVVVRKELANEPELLRAVFEGFCKAKDGMIEQYEKGLTFTMMANMVPWFANDRAGPRADGAGLVALRREGQPRSRGCSAAVSSRAGLDQSTPDMRRHLRALTSGHLTRPTARSSTARRSAFFPVAGQTERLPSR